jgi:hypothetical protein
MNEEELLRQLKHNLVIFAKDYRRIFKEYKGQLPPIKIGGL